MVLPEGVLESGVDAGGRRALVTPETREGRIPAGVEVAVVLPEGVLGSGVDAGGRRAFVTPETREGRIPG